MPLLVLNSVYLIYSALLLLFEVEISSKGCWLCIPDVAISAWLPFLMSPFSYLSSLWKIRTLIQSKCHPPHLPQQALLLIMGNQSCVKPHIGPHQQDCLCGLWNLLHDIIRSGFYWETSCTRKRMLLGYFLTCSGRPEYLARKGMFWLRIFYCDLEIWIHSESIAIESY